MAFYCFLSKTTVFILYNQDLHVELEIYSCFIARCALHGLDLCGCNR